MGRGKGSWGEKGESGEEKEKGERKEGESQWMKTKDFTKQLWRKQKRDPRRTVKGIWEYTVELVPKIYLGNRFHKPGNWETGVPH